MIVQIRIYIMHESPVKAFNNKTSVSAIIAEDVSVLIAFIIIKVAVIPHEETVLIVSPVWRTIFPSKFKAHRPTCGSL